MRITVSVSETIPLRGLDDYANARHSVSIEGDVPDGMSIREFHARLSEAARALFIQQVARTVHDHQVRTQSGVKPWLREEIAAIREKDWLVELLDSPL